MAEVDEIITRRAPAGTRTLDLDARTVEVVWSTGAGVRRRDMDGPFLEVLSLDPRHVRLDRFNSGASLLDSHDAYSMERRLGTVVPGTARIENGVGLATVRFSSSPLADTLLRDLAAGHRLQVSVGYRIHAVTREEGTGDELPTVRAVDWEPLELSAVCVPADPLSFSRSISMESVMPDPIAAPPLAPSADDLETVRIFGPAEKKRMVERAGLGQDFYRRHARKDELGFRTALIDALADADDRDATHTHVDTRGGQDETVTRRAAMVEALRHRVLPGEALSEPAREYVGLTIPEMARRYLDQAGQRTHGFSTGDVMQRAFHTTSDFPLIMGDAMGTVLRKSYEEASAPLKQVARKTTARDFRAKTVITFSEAPDLLKVNEHGEFKAGTMVEGYESYKIDTFGRLIGFTRQLLVNDQIDAFGQMTIKLGRAAKRFEAAFLVNLVETNPKMSDGKALFHADHGNLAGAGTPLNIASLTAARKAMRKQVDIKGDMVTVSPKHLVVSAELETQAEMVLAEIHAMTVDEVNPWSGKLTIVVEPRLSLNNGLTWYLAAAPSEAEGLEYAHLEGSEQPFFDTRHGFEVDGVEFKVRLDFGAGFLDHRSWYKNTGAV